MINSERTRGRTVHDTSRLCEVLNLIATLAEASQRDNVLVDIGRLARAALVGSTPVDPDECLDRTGEALRISTMQAPSS